MTDQQTATATPEPAPTARRRVTVTRTFTIDIDGSTEAYIAFADELARYLGIDCLDAGDATGAFLNLASIDLARAQSAGPWCAHAASTAPEPVHVTVNYTDDLYRWGRHATATDQTANQTADVSGDENGDGGDDAE